MLLSQKRFFKCDKERKHIECYPLGNGGLPSGKLASNYTDVLASGKKKVKEIFNEKVFELFPELRYQLLTSSD